MKLEDLAKSKFYQVLVADYESEIFKLMQPDKIPDDDLAEVKAHKKILLFLQDKIKQLKKLKDDRKEPNLTDSYE